MKHLYVSASVAGTLLEVALLLWAFDAIGIDYWMAEKIGHFIYLVTESIK